jgi:S-formylglutathione hydrolase
LSVHYFATVTGIDAHKAMPSVLQDTKKAAIFGHSMGGHGALTLYLKYPSLYRSASAFAPITNPTKAPWGHKAFAGPNGNDGYLKGGIEEGKQWDATELLQQSKGRKVDILVDTVRSVPSRGLCALR